MKTVTLVAHRHYNGDFIVDIIGFNINRFLIPFLVCLF